MAHAWEAAAGSSAIIELDAERLWLADEECYCRECFLTTVVMY